MKLLHRWGGKDREPLTGEWLEDREPATGRLLARIARGGAAEIEAAVASAAAAQREWAEVPPPRRAELLERVADRLEAESEDLAALESRDTGKPLTLARTVDVPRAVENFRFFASALRQDQTPCHAMGDALNYSLRRPLGVVGLITPWNLPLYLLSWKLAPALAMGNAAVAKPSELTPCTAGRLAKIVDRACAALELPVGIFALVHGLGAEAGEALVEHPGVRGISFTGGTVTGARVAAAAAPHCKKLSLELGGKNPTLVFADADLDAAVDGAARAAFLNQGQICLCGSRILVQDSIYPAFEERLVAAARVLTPGDPAAPGTRMGSLISPAHRDEVEGYLRLAREEGGRILCGGRRPELPQPWRNGAFLEATLIEGLAPDSRCAREEIFGPVATLHPFRDESEALALANGVDYGLSASLWTRDLERAHRFAAALECGMVWVNTWLKRDLRVPFGGSKRSGVGREGGHWSLDFYSEIRNVCIQL